jgi:glycogen debranching enzyme
MPHRKLGAHIVDNGTEFAVWSKHASHVDLCLFDDEGETSLPMTRDENHIHRLLVKGLGQGARYGYRAHGLYSPHHGLWFDAAKLLVDPYAKQLDQNFVYHPNLGIYNEDTSHLVPKAVVTSDVPTSPQPPMPVKGGLIYEIAVRPFTMLNPDIPAEMRGTVAALAHPSIITHLKRIGVSAVELMPITAKIDERHLQPLGLTNSWGYNPVALMALDPQLVPGGMAELQQTVASLQQNGIGVILDLVFNHTGESDVFGPTLSMRGLDNLAYYRHLPDRPGDLINDAGCGNTLACDHPIVQDLVLDSLRHFVRHAGVDGFRFDLASILGRSMHGFSENADLLTAMISDPLLADRILIAEPWDIGPGGYQLGNFPAPFLEWNDRARDDLRMFWRGDDHMIGKLATVLAGSSNHFSRDAVLETRSVNFLAAHDGFTLMDLVSYREKHNEANGENNRDGHNDNHSWNNGAEGPTDNPDVQNARKTDVMAMLSSLFASRGTIMLTAGDEMGRSQNGNNNAYAQDNAITWLDWTKVDSDILGHVNALSALRKRFSVFSDTRFFTGQDQDIEWLSASGQPMTIADWENPWADCLVMRLKTVDTETGETIFLSVIFNRSQNPVNIDLSQNPDDIWVDALKRTVLDLSQVPPRSVSFAHRFTVL